MCPGRAWLGRPRPRYDDKPIDLPEFIVQNRERLALKPNDDYSDQHTYFGWEMEAAAGNAP